jgi:hypothetical protein
MAMPLSTTPDFMTQAPKDLKGYKYALEYVKMSEEDRRKLTDILNSDLKCEEISGREEIALGNPSIKMENALKHMVSVTCVTTKMKLFLCKEQA